MKITIYSGLPKRCKSSKTRAQEIARLLSDLTTLYGGTTVMQGDGGWAGESVYAIEPVIVVCIHLPYPDGYDKAHETAEMIRVRMDQHTVLLEIQDNAHWRSYIWPIENKAGSPGG